MKVTLDTRKLERQLDNIVGYSVGFLNGTQQGKKVFLDNLADGVIVAMGKYVDVMARMNPDALHHVYEWYQYGSPSARLFDLDYFVTGSGISINGTFRQSLTMSKDATKPFYDKAKIMEEGRPVTIAPKESSVLAFNSGGETVFTKSPVTIYSPGGEEVQGSFERVLNDFMLNYFKQSFLRASGLYRYLSNPIIYKQNFAQGARLGRSYGTRIGFKWIANASLGVEDIE